MFKSVLILALVLFTVYSRTTTENLDSYTFEQFLEEYEKSYLIGSDEYNHREQIFYKNVKFISEHNKKNDGLVLGVNNFADLTTEEMNQYKGYKKGDSPKQEIRFLEESETILGDIPKTLDWRNNKGVVSAVKNQKSCGSCWAFSAVESMESAQAIKTGQEAPILSPQQLVDCSKNPHHCGGTGGCEGSIPELAFKYAESAGMVSESDYPYTAKTGTCQMSGKSPVMHTKGYVDVKSNDRNALLNAIQIQPISISVDAGDTFWHFYFSGIFHKCTLTPELDHAVQLVGYDMTDPDNSYWLVRNSWGHRWGMSGYIKLKMYPDQPATSSYCGVDSNPKVGTGCDGGPSTINVCGQCGILYAPTYPKV